ncbi:MAG TPA: hypothetical protein VGH70_04280 [Bradyrhizobium sp.]|jgi:hypothetical protein
MTALVQVLFRLTKTASYVDFTWKVLTVFCLAGLVVSLLCATHGLDLSPGFF